MLKGGITDTNAAPPELRRKVRKCDEGRALGIGGRR